MHEYIRRYVPVVCACWFQTLSHSPTHVPAYIPTSIHTCTPTYIYIYTHTYIHTYIHTHTNSRTHIHKTQDEVRQVQSRPSPVQVNNYGGTVPCSTGPEQHFCKSTFACIRGSSWLHRDRQATTQPHINKHLRTCARWFAAARVLSGCEVFPSRIHL